ncbi:MAG TPA: hypothetical protein VMH49_05440 [Thermoplasmata archaeon]|nr:hypothetical protein [Thermoplasmata archaeon]
MPIVVAVVLTAMMLNPAAAVGSPAKPAGTSSPTPASPSPATATSPTSGGAVSLCSASECGGPETTVTATVPCSESGCGSLNASALAEVKGRAGGYFGTFDPCLTVLSIGSESHPQTESTSTSTTSGSATLTVGAGVAFWVSVKACATASVHISWCCISWHHPFGRLMISAGVGQIQLIEDYGFELQATAANTGSGEFNVNDFGDPDLAIDLFDTQVPLLVILGIPVLTLDISADIALEYSATLAAGANGAWTLLSPAPVSGCSATLGSSWTSGSPDSQTQTWTPSGGWTSSSYATHCDSLSLNSFYGSLVGRIGPYISVGVDLLWGLATLTVWAFLFGQVSLYGGGTDLTVGTVTNLAAPACDPGGGGSHCSWIGPGSCGSNYVVDGLTILPMLYANGFQPSQYLPSSQPNGIPWGVVCAALGLEIGFNWSLAWSSYSGTIWYFDFIFLALPLASTAVVCNVATPSCTPAFTFTTVAYEPWSWAWDPARLDIYPGAGMIVLTPILERVGANYEEIPTTWSAPPIELVNNTKQNTSCGYITSGQSLSYANTTVGLLPPLASPTAVISAQVEDWVPPPNPPNGTVCQFHVGLNGMPLGITGVQLSEVTFNVLLTYPPPPNGGGTGAPYGGGTAGPYAWSFVETGLPAGKTFEVTVNGNPMSLSTDGNADTLTFTEPNGTYAYATTGVAGYSTAWRGQGHGSGTINGAGMTTLIQFRSSSYLITLNVSGYPDNGSLYATVGGIAHNGVFVGGVGFNLIWGLVAGESFPNGTYSWNVTPVSGYRATYAGTVTVSGADVTIYLKLTPINRLNFTETGLPPGAAWTAAVLEPDAPFGAVDHNATATLSVPVPNGSFVYLVEGPSGYVVSGSPTGVVSVSGDNVTDTVSVHFVSGRTISVGFTAKNPPESAGWCAAIVWTSCTGGKSLSWTNLTPGSYPYAVLPASPYEGFTESVKIGGHTAAHSGTVALKANTKVAVTFQQVDYALTIAQSGLAKSTHWSVSLTGALNGVNRTESASGKGPSVTFHVPNGSYVLTFKPVHGYVAPATLTVVVDGNATTVAVTYTPSVSGGTSRGVSDLLLAGGKAGV